MEDLPLQNIARALTPKECILLSQTCRSVRDAFRQTKHGDFLLRFGSSWGIHNVTDFLNAAVYYDDPEILDWIHAAHYDLTTDARFCAVAAALSKENSLEWYRKKNCHRHASVAQKAARYGHVTILQWALRNGCTVDATATVEALDADRLDVFEWLLEKGCPCDERTVRTAAKKNAVEAIEMMRTRGKDVSDGLAVYDAAKNGNVAALDLLAGLPRSQAKKDAMKCGIMEAIMDDDLTTLRLLRDRDCVWCENDLCKWAAKLNKTKILKWAASEKMTGDEWCCAFAAENDNLPLLRWLRKNDFPWDHKTCAGAAQRGNLKLLKWARKQKNPPPWSALTASYARWNGHDELLRWLRKQKCPE